MKTDLRKYFKMIKFAKLIADHLEVNVEKNVYFKDEILM